jgi:hypothetical protein
MSMKLLTRRRTSYQILRILIPNTFDELIQTSGEISTVLLVMIKYRSTISTQFVADFNKMGLETQEDLDDLIAVVNND